jgi:hypothetical protein
MELSHGSTLNFKRRKEMDADAKNSRGMIAVDKVGTKVLFLNPVTYETRGLAGRFPRTVHELLVVADADQFILSGGRMTRMRSVPDSAIHVSPLRPSI